MRLYLNFGKHREHLNLFSQKELNDMEVVDTSSGLGFGKAKKKVVKKYHNPFERKPLDSWVGLTVQEWVVVVYSLVFTLLVDNHVDRNLLLANTGSVFLREFLIKSLKQNGLKKEAKMLEKNRPLFQIIYTLVAFGYYRNELKHLVGYQPVYVGRSEPWINRVSKFLKDKLSKEKNVVVVDEPSEVIEETIVRDTPIRTPRGLRFRLRKPFSSGMKTDSLRTSFGNSNEPVVYFKI